MAVTDFLVGLLSPVGLPIELRLVISPFFCKMGYAGIMALTSVSINHLAFVSFDRFFMIKFPLRYKSLVTKRRVMAFIVASWLWGSVIAVPLIFEFDFVIKPSWRSEGGGACLAELMFPLWFVVALFTLHFALPFLVMAFVYQYIFRVASKQRKAIHESFSSTSRKGINVTVRRRNTDDYEADSIVDPYRSLPRNGAVGVSARKCNHDADVKHGSLTRKNGINVSVHDKRDGDCGSNCFKSLTRKSISKCNDKHDAGYDRVGSNLKTVVPNGVIAPECRHDVGIIPQEGEFQSCASSGIVAHNNPLYKLENETVQNGYKDNSVGNGSVLNETPTTAETTSAAAALPQYGTGCCDADGRETPDSMEALRSRKRSCSEETLLSGSEHGEERRESSENSSVGGKDADRTVTDIGAGRAREGRSCSVQSDTRKTVLRRLLEGRSSLEPLQGSTTRPRSGSVQSDSRIIKQLNEERRDQRSNSVNSDTRLQLHSLSKGTFSKSMASLFRSATTKRRTLSENGKARLRAARLLILPCGFFYVTWAPWFTLIMWAVASGRLVEPHFWERFVQTLCVLNSLGNPILYAVTQPQLGRAMLNKLTKLWKACKARSAFGSSRRKKNGEFNLSLAEDTTLVRSPAVVSDEFHSEL